MNEKASYPCFILRFQERAEGGDGSSNTYVNRRTFAESTHLPYDLDASPLAATQTLTATRESPDKDVDQCIIAAATQTQTRQGRETPDTDPAVGTKTLTETRESDDLDHLHKSLRAIPRSFVN